jgi:hypothetical protein
MKLTILKRYDENQLKSVNQSLEAALDQLIANKYGIYFLLEHS